MRAWEYRGNWKWGFVPRQLGMRQRWWTTNNWVTGSTSGIVHVRHYSFIPLDLFSTSWPGIVEFQGVEYLYEKPYTSGIFRASLMQTFWCGGRSVWLRNWKVLPHYRLNCRTARGVYAQTTVGFRWTMILWYSFKMARNAYYASMALMLSAALLQGFVVQFQSPNAAPPATAAHRSRKTFKVFMFDSGGVVVDNDRVRWDSSNSCVIVFA